MKLRKFEIEEMKVILNNLYNDYLNDYSKADEQRDEHAKDLALGSLSVINHLTFLTNGGVENFTKRMDAHFEEAVNLTKDPNQEISRVTYYIGKLSAIQNVRKQIEKPLPWVSPSNIDLRG